MSDLERLGHAIATLPDGQSWAHRSVRDHVLRLLALRPSQDRAEAAARIAADLPAASVRRTAAWLAAAQSEQVLVSLLAGDLPTELGACLLHEMIVRRKPVTRMADAWAARLTGHALAGLPLHPLPGETRLPLADFGHGTESAGLPHGPRKGDPLTHAGTVPESSREAAPADLTSAVTTWLTQSNGRAEAAVCRLGAPLSPDEVGVRTMESLGLDCLAGDGLALRRAGLDDVVAVLFGAAANGGAYDRGLDGAYGRAAAWRSVDALAGGSHVGAAWWTFDAANDWFRRVAWDLGVVCLRPGGHTMAVLAATDTD
ncbi:DUF6183 family protein [Actinophytocola oryzae]|uniref:Uncharacterized protein n=1 Tax=Actinophytocola oryzae TaxID=502181 RepID=A0A4R7UY73_9PSEU|nr:DUF6183 family protein [Actinophytocola oryzae]TDV41470.1 hypothetical protein CLV71_120160 [Actinophytocola oryzae]